MKTNLKWKLRIAILGRELSNASLKCSIHLLGRMLIPRFITEEKWENRKYFRIYFKNMKTEFWMNRVTAFLTKDKSKYVVKTAVIVWTSGKVNNRFMLSLKRAGWSTNGTKVLKKVENLGWAEKVKENRLLHLWMNKDLRL